MVQTFPDDFQTDGSVLFCKMCDIDVAAEQLCQVNQHLRTKKHKASVERKRESTNGKTQSFITTIGQPTEKSRDTNAFYMDLTKAFVKSNIPINVIRGPAMTEFLEKHTKYAAPSETVLRTKYLPAIYDDIVAKLKQIVKGKHIWVSLDETTDSEQRYVVNFVFGVLGVEEERGRCYLFSSDVLEKVNSSTIAKFFDETISELGKLYFKVVSI